MILWAILIVSVINLVLTFLLWRRQQSNDSESVIAAIKKSRELLLEALYGMRQHVSVAADTIVNDQKAVLKDVAATREKLTKLVGL